MAVQISVLLKVFLVYFGMELKVVEIVTTYQLQQKDFVTTSKIFKIQRFIRVTELVTSLK